jgi:hypothetical protein
MSLIYIHVTAGTTCISRLSCFDTRGHNLCHGKSQETIERGYKVTVNVERLKTPFNASDLFILYSFHQVSMFKEENIWWYDLNWFRLWNTDTSIITQPEVQNAHALACIIVILTCFCCTSKTYLSTIFSTIRNLLKFNRIHRRNDVKKVLRPRSVNYS